MLTCIVFQSKYSSNQNIDYFYKTWLKESEVSFNI